jgi:hypothetical protein
MEYSEEYKQEVRDKLVDTLGSMEPYDWDEAFRKYMEGLYE